MNAPGAPGFYLLNFGHYTEDPDSAKTPIVITTRSGRRFSRMIFGALFPMGAAYGKAEEVKETEDRSKSGRECRISDTRVRLFGDNLAVV